MTPINKQRLGRARRFALYGAIAAGMFLLAVLLMDNLNALSNGKPFFPSTGDELFLVLRTFILSMLSLGILGAIFGAITARFYARVWAWRIGGMAMIVIGIFLAVELMFFLEPVWIARFMGLIVSIMAIALGCVLIHESTNRAADNL